MRVQQRSDPTKDEAEEQLRAILVVNFPTLAETNRNRPRPDPSCSAAGIAGSNPAGGGSNRGCRSAHNPRILEADGILRRTALSSADVCFRWPPVCAAGA